MHGRAHSELGGDGRQRDRGNDGMTVDDFKQRINRIVVDVWDQSEAKAKRHRLEDRAAEVKAHLNELNKQLEELEATHRERREEKE